jgi:hypothetical protein
MDGVCPGQVKELKRLIQFVRYAREKDLQMKISDKMFGKLKHTAIALMMGTKNRRKASLG